MPKLPRFHIRDRHGAPTGEVTPYYPLLVTAGTATHKLALHRDAFDAWIVSDPVSGSQLLNVPGCYRGVRISSVGYSVNRIRPGAQVEVDQLIQRIGSDQFNQVLAQARAKIQTEETYHGLDHDR